MKVSITAVLATLAASTLAADCRREGGSSYRYVITADGVDDIPGICGGLWDNLKRFSDCVTPSDTSCGGEDGNLSWDFRVSTFCNAGMVQSTWWEATKNNYGAVEC